MPKDQEKQDQSNKTGAIIDDWGTGDVYFPEMGSRPGGPPTSKNAPKSATNRAQDTLSSVGNLLVKAGAGYDKAMGAGVPEGGLKSEARVGGAPAQLAVPFNPSSVPGAPPTPNVPPPQGAPPRTGANAGAPTSFGSKSEKQGAVVGSAIDNIAQAIHTFKSKRDADALSKAQNSFQLFQTALQQGDQHTANLLATDPKVVKGWEKYLKMEFPRETGTPDKKPTGTVPPDRSIMDKMTGHNKAPMSRLPDMNTPGGIAVPQPGPEQQLHTAMVNQMIEGLKKGDPRAIASVYGPNYKLTPEEFRASSRHEYGFELSPVQVAAMDEHSKLVLLKSKADFMKFVSGQSIISQRAEDVANINGAWRLAGDEARANATRDAARYRAEAIKALKTTPADKMNEVIMKSNMDSYSHMATTLSTVGGALIKSDHKKEGEALLKEAQGYMKQSEEIRVRMEAFEDMKKLGIDIESLGEDGGTDDEEP